MSLRCRRVLQAKWGFLSNSLHPHNQLRTYCEGLRDLYTINQQTDIPRAELRAHSSARNFPSFLRLHPMANHTLQAFEFAQKWRRREQSLRPLCLDSGCGHGESTKRLARLLPHCDIIGIDKSSSRLAKAFAQDRLWDIDGDISNAILLRADLVDFWTLCVKNHIFPSYHFLLYPNPYPKAKHFKVLCTK